MALFDEPKQQEGTGQIVQSKDRKVWLTTAPSAIPSFLTLLTSVVFNLSVSALASYTIQLLASVSPLALWLILPLCLYSITLYQTNKTLPLLAIAVGTAFGIIL